MDALRSKAKELLETKAVAVVIGWAEGSGGKVRPFFATRPAEAQRLVYDARCTHNLALYLARREVRKLGKAALCAPPATARAVLQMMAESQLKDGQALVLGLTPDGALVDIPDAKALEAFAAAWPAVTSDSVKAMMARLEAMTPEERWAFWLKELSQCTKCYACRQACPLCYCANCLMECNQPQWIPASSHMLGNLEWHLVRAMHLAGRCVGCGECGRACPLDIPIHLLTSKVADSVQQHFGARAGMSSELEYALSTFKTDDKEHFIR